MKRFSHYDLCNTIEAELKGSVEENKATMRHIDKAIGLYLRNEKREMAESIKSRIDHLLEF